MKKVSLKELGEYFANVYKETTGEWYSNDIDDWKEDLRRYEDNAVQFETLANGTTERYKVDETEFIKGKCVRINFIIECITIDNTVNVAHYLSDYDYRKYVANEL